MTTSRIAGRQSQDGTAIDLPPLASGWKWMKVGDVGEVRLGRQRSPEHHSGKHMRPYLRVANVYEDRIDLDDLMQMNFTPAEFETYRLRRGDILLNEGQSLEWVGRPAMFKDEVPGACFQNTLIRFRPHAFVDGSFALFIFRYYLHSRRFQKIAKWTVNIAHLGAQRLAEIEFPVPPLEEQRRIVAKIEELFSDLDAGVAALERVRANLKRYRAAVLKAAVEGRLTAEWRSRNPVAPQDTAANLLERILADRRAKWEQDQLRKFKEAGKTPPKGWKEKYKSPHELDLEPGKLPSTWAWASLDQLCQRITDGTHLPPKFVQAGIPFVFVKHIVGGSITFDGTRFISEETYKELNDRCPVERGDVLYSAVGSYGVAVPVDTSDPFSFQRHIAHLKPSQHVSHRFLVLCLNSETCLRQAHRQARGVAQKTVTLGDLAKFGVPIAPNAEQSAIVAEVDRRLSVADAAEQQVEHALQRAARLRQAILKRAFEGRLVPQDPADEPAATMLTRMKSPPEATSAASRKHTVGRRIRQKA